MPTLDELLRQREQLAAEPVESQTPNAVPTSRLGKGIFALTQMIGDKNPTAELQRLRQQRAAIIDQNRRRQLGGVDEQIKTREALEGRARAMDATDPMSAVSAKAQQTVTRQINSIGKFLNRQIPEEFIEPYQKMSADQLSKLNVLKETSGLIKQLQDYEAKMAQAGETSRRSARFGAEAKRRQATSVRSAANQIVGQRAIELRELRKSLRSAEALKGQGNLAEMNPIARGSLGFLAARTSGSSSQLSDAEREVFTRAGGTLLKVKQAFTDILNGTLVPEMNKYYQAWADVLVDVQGKQLRAEKDNMLQQFKSLGFSKDELGDFNMEQYFDSLTGTAEETIAKAGVPSDTDIESMSDAELKAFLGQ